MTRHTVVAALLTLVVAAAVSGQSQRSPATLDDLLREVRALRGDLNESLRSTTRHGTRRAVALCYGVSPAPACGRVSVKVVPAPTVLCTVTCPPCAAITSCTI